MSSNFQNVYSEEHPEELFRYINLKLASLGQPTSHSTADPRALEIAGPLLRNFYQKDQVLGYRLCPADARIQSFLDAYLSDLMPQGAPRLPGNTFVLDRPGLARVMSLPPGKDTLASPYLQSYRVPQGILHNPRSDRRTTKGIFHIAEGGLPVPADKIAVPKRTFAALLAAALVPPPDVMTLPFTADQHDASAAVRLASAAPAGLPRDLAEAGKDDGDPLLRPRQPGQQSRFRRSASSAMAAIPIFRKTTPRSTSSTGPATPAASSSRRIWSASARRISACRTTTQATERQRRDGMCWSDPEEVYNDGGAFKLACRDHRGVMVTIIADNYYGYCKKEVKTQISYAANLYGICEEEHAGGALAFPAYVLGQQFYAGRTVLTKQVTFAEAMHWLGDRVEIHPERYAIDRRYPDHLSTCRRTPNSAFRKASFSGS